MPGYPECPVCPYEGDPGKTCHAFAAKNRRICELIELGRQWEARVVELTEANPVPPPAPPGPPPLPQPVVTEGADPIPLAVTLAVAKCPDRGAPIECGCAAERRYCGETLDLMVWGGCVACKAAGQTAT